MVSRTVQVANKTGLHARPAALFVQEANKFKSTIRVNKDGMAADAKSIISVLALGVEQGTGITIEADGEDEKEALESLIKLVEGKFGEE